MRNLNFIDQIIIHFDQQFINTKNIFTQKRSISLMRVNHAGEVCAQALYHGQALVARNKLLENKLLKAGEEEQLHLDWCDVRIKELGGKKSILNPLWAAGSFGIGILAGLAGDKISLGFIAETERQVIKHLDKHLSLLPAEDHKSREILIKMRADEQKHATSAIEEGGVPLPRFIQVLMAATAKIMTTASRLM